MKKVVGVGACVLDTLIECNAYPTEDKKYRANSVKKTGGGPVSNALVVLAKMGIESEFVGLLSADNDGDFLKSEFERYGVKTAHVKQVENSKAFTSYIVLSKESGSRTCVFERGSVPDEPKHLDLSAVDGADVVHLDGNSLNCALEVAKYAKEKGILVSLDAGGLYENIEKLLPYVDILIPSEEFAQGITKLDDTTKAIKALNEKFAPKVLAVTQGSKGGLYIKDGNVYHYDSFKVNCVDSNGAGDTFHGAFLSAYLKGYQIEDCTKIASATSAIKCTKVGMRDALPTFEEVLEFIKANK